MRKTRRILPLVVDDEYETTIKSLHSAILAYIAEVQGQDLPSQWMERLFALQQASRDIVEAVKAMKHMHKNLAGRSECPAHR